MWESQWWMAVMKECFMGWWQSHLHMNATECRRRSHTRKKVKYIISKEQYGVHQPICLFFEAAECYWKNCRYMNNSIWWTVNWLVRMLTAGGIVKHIFLAFIIVLADVSLFSLQYICTKFCHSHTDSTLRHERTGQTVDSLWIITYIRYCYTQEINKNYILCKMSVLRHCNNTGLNAREQIKRTNMYTYAVLLSAMLYITDSCWDTLANWSYPVEQILWISTEVSSVTAVKSYNLSYTESYLPISFFR